ncbi:MAG: peptidoglycan-associated lipoprotein Pal [Terriglobia bacterium]
MAKKRVLAVLVGLLGVILLAGACHKKKIVAPPPPAPPPAPAAPTVTLNAEPSTIEKGQSATLSWTSTGATKLDLEPNIGSVQAQGSTTVTPDDSTTYTMTATGPGGTQTQTARVTVTTPPPPPPPTPQAPAFNASEWFNANIKDAYFNFNKSDIRPDAAQALQHDADMLKQHPDVKFTVEGHCDERGSEEYNLGLGDRRATAVKNYLVNLGVSADNVMTISYGKDKPFCTDHTESCWQQNRRGHLVVGTESQQGTQ